MQNRSLGLLLALTALACSGSEGTPDSGVPDLGPALKCMTDDDCPADQYCEDSSMSCQPGTGNACEMDEECGDGQRCNTNPTDCGAMRCRNFCEPAPCAGHQDCGAWVCIDGTCAEPPSCATDACPLDLICNDQMVCVAPTPCTEDSECGDDICAGGICMPAQACTDNTDCTGGLVCQDGTCDDRCNADAQCGDPALPSCEIGTGVCRARCAVENDCQSGFICEAPNCLPAQCANDGDCGDATLKCDGEENGHGRCVNVNSCEDNDDCLVNFTCNNMFCVELPTCLTDRECGIMEYCEDRHCQPAEACNAGACPIGLDCVDNRCVPAVCQGNGDCEAAEACVGGACVPTPSPNFVAEVRILTPDTVARFTESAPFVAVALDTAGDLVPGISFDWSSSDENVATIDGDGLATALNQAGVTEITASVDLGAQTVTSTAVRFTVLAAVQAGLRVTVVERATGASLPGVTVVCGAETQTTDAAGIANFTATAPTTCTAYSANHDYLTAVLSDGDDLLLSLGGLSRANSSAGYTGTVDTSALVAPVRLSFSGGSFAAPLSSFSAANVLGGDVFSFDLPVIGAVAFPSGATASAELMGFPVDLKTTYYARSSAGIRRGWTFAGGAELSDLGLAGGSSLLLNILPLMQTFTHGGSSGLDTLTELPFIVDTADIDGDGDTTEMVPDYNNFVSRNHTPQRAQTLRYVIDGASASLPVGANSVIIVSGAILPTVGFVPLGLDGIALPPGAIGRFTTTMTPPYDGLEYGEYAILALAVELIDGSLPQVASTKMFVGPSLPQELALGAGWLAFPSAGFTDGTRTINVPAIPDADLWRAHFRSTTGGWEVYAESATVDLALPTPPMGFEDRSQGGLDVSVIELSSPGTLSELLRPGTDALHMDRSTSGFSQQRVR